jgi:hypothetical protein
MKHALAPVWGLPHMRIPRAVAAEARATAGADAVGAGPGSGKLHRTRLALRNAGTARSEHLLALEARGATSIEEPEAG